MRWGLATGTSFVGRYAVDLGRTASDPVVAGKPLPVGCYEGVKPDVSRWRLKNTGLSGASAEFAAEGGLILATPRVNGIVIIVR